VSAAAALQEAVVAALAGADGIAGVAPVFDGAPPAQPYPYVVLGDGLVLDWGTKTGAGQEHRVTIAIWDEAGRVGRLHALIAAAEGAMAALPRMLAGNRIVSVAHLRSRVLRPAKGPWAGMVEHRVRTVVAA